MEPSRRSDTSRRDRPPPRPVQISQIQQLTPHMVRVSVTGDSLADFPIPGPASHLKLFFPNLDPTADRPINRTYTPRRWDPATGRLDIDILVHGSGVGINLGRRGKDR
jgi:NADPH-dependent ferric siderophore reductase